MSKFIPRMFKFQGFLTVELKEWLSKGYIEVILCAEQEMQCFKCKHKLSKVTSGYDMKVRHLSILQYKCFLIFKRRVGYCSNCKKERSEYIEFISEESPHVTKDLAWFTSKLCEIASVSNAARMLNIDKMQAYRIDYRILIRLLSGYKIPKITKISVDEVYARKKKKKGETRSDLFVTIITDLKTHKAIYVSQSRRKEALDEFFILLGVDACRKIKVVACDQHSGYHSSVKEYCPKATIVLDRFHLMQNFNLALNDARITLHMKKSLNKNIREKFRGKYKFIFLKRTSQRTDKEKAYVHELMELNQDFFLLELIKEKFTSFFDVESKEEAKEIWRELEILIVRSMDTSLLLWFKELNKKLSMVLNYFKYKVTTSVSEGINNVVKMLKRRAFGYKDMKYFALKILQKCGYLNSQYISKPYELGIKI